MSKLNTWVHVHRMETDSQGRLYVAETQAFGPGDTLPAWAVKAVTNPKVWADGAPAAESASTGSTGGAAVPPKGGPGSGKEAWAAYATAKGVEVTDEMRSRDDIIAALEKAGVPTE